VNTYGQFLDKNETLNIWSHGLYRRSDEKYTGKLLSMIKYAINDCLAVTKLAYTMGQDIGSMYELINLLLLFSFHLLV
jgi:hypothetical protein